MKQARTHQTSNWFAYLSAALDINEHGVHAADVLYIHLRCFAPLAHNGSSSDELQCVKTGDGENVMSKTGVRETVVGKLQAQKVQR